MPSWVSIAFDGFCATGAWLMAWYAMQLRKRLVPMAWALRRIRDGVGGHPRLQARAVLEAVDHSFVEDEPKEPTVIIREEGEEVRNERIH